MSHHNIPIVICPVCQEDVAVTLKTWHRNCGDSETEAWWRAKLADIKDYHNIQRGPDEWIPAKKGGFWARFFGLVLVVKQQKNGPWCGVVFEGGREDNDAPPVVPWKFGFPNAATAQRNLSKAATKHLLESYDDT